MTLELWKSTGGLDCKTCLAHLADYVRRELNGQAAEQIYAEITFHLETCPTCEAAYYREFRRQGQRKTIAELRQIEPHPQITEVMRQILPPVEAGLPLTPEPGWDQVILSHGQAWLERATGRWRQLWLSLPALGKASSEVPALAGLMASAPSPTSTLGSLTVTPPDGSFEVRLVVTPDPASASPELCQVEVALFLSDRFGDFSGLQVSLAWGETLYTKETDILGKVSFAGLPCRELPAMRLYLLLG